MTNKILAINTRYYPALDNSREIPTTVVLVAGEIGDYAAYCANVKRENAQFAADYGDKISFEEASVQFLGLKREKYRD